MPKTHKNKSSFTYSGRVPKNNEYINHTKHKIKWADDNDDTRINFSDTPKGRRALDEWANRYYWEN